MVRIAYAWELGGNFGHLSRMVPIALALRERGHDIVFVVRDVGLAARTLTRLGLNYIQAPVVSFSRHGFEPPVSYSERLLILGYADPTKLLGAAQAWVNLLQLLGADLVISDYAPTALLAAHITGTCCIRIGSGFENPPAQCPIPWTRLHETADCIKQLQVETRIAAAVNLVLSAFSRPKIDNFAQLLANAPLILTTYRELDHYKRGDGSYVGHVGSDVDTHEPEWICGDSGPKILAYLRPSMKEIRWILEALQSPEFNALCVIPGYDQLTARLSSTCRIVSRAVALSPLLMKADCVVSYGGAGLVAEALLAGLPLLLLPQSPEQEITAQRVESLGAGQRVSLNGSEEFSAAATSFLNRRTMYANAASKFQRKYARCDSSAPKSLVADRVESLIRNSQPLTEDAYEFARV